MSTESETAKTLDMTELTKNLPGFFRSSTELFLNDQTH